MDLQSRQILVAAMQEKRELVQMLYNAGRPEDGQKEYTELRRLGQLLREVINGDTRASNQGIEPDPPTE